MLKFSEEVKGHDLIQDQICQALKKDRLPHALLFSGPTGVGKTKLAWALAKVLLCEKDPATHQDDSLFLWDKEEGSQKTEADSSANGTHQFKPCGVCLSCRNVEKKENVSILKIKAETLQIRLQDLKPVLPFLSLQTEAQAKIILIDSAEKLNLQASNFLLKTIEEPPPQTFFFLISSQASQISLTIRSRLQNIHFDPLSDSLVKELSPVDTEKWMIKSSRGRMDLLEELQSNKDLRSQSFQFLFDCIKKELSEIDLSTVLKNRQTALNVLKFWRVFLRDLRLLSFSFEEEMINRDQIEKMKELHFSSKAGLDFLIQHTLELENDLKSNVDVKLGFENLIIPMKEILNLKASF